MCNALVVIDCQGIVLSLILGDRTDNRMFTCCLLVLGINEKVASSY